ncbi:MAG TPA: FAD-binding oxidoreductase, partial [Solirubrobacteraceae bacterium]|nr:FAD-binding oxidoreductase [Solirubrobacteraceae bacterium]
AVALPESAEDVMAVVRMARERGLRVAAQGTGHNAGPLGADLERTILVRTERMKGVIVDPAGRRARVQAGATWGDVVAAVSEHGLTALSGSSHDVGVVGYLLGGGMSWMARKHGLGVNHVHAIEVVTADGHLVRADHDHEPDLFWALRGGSGNFGVVTAVEIGLFDVQTAYAGMLVWPAERAAEVLKAWVRWSETAPEEITTSARLMNLPPIPDIPEPFRGRSLVVIDGAYTGDEAGAVQALRPLRELAPEVDTFATIPTAALIEIHMDPPEPVPGIGDGAMLGRLDDAAIDAFVAAAGPGSGSPLLLAELRHAGGAAGRAPQGHGATGALDGAYVFFAAGMAVAPELAEAIAAHLPKVKAAIAPWMAGREYWNFTERAGADAAGFFEPEVYARLRRVKAAYDAADRFRGNHPIPPA